MSIYFAVEGGFANQPRSITIADGGEATVDVNGVVSDAALDEATLAAMVDELDGSGLFDRDRAYDAKGADLQRYEIRYAGSTLITYDTSVPDQLVEAIRLLEEAIRAARTG